MSQTPPLFDTKALHPDAAASIDADGEALLRVAETGSLRRQSSSEFKSRQTAAETITDADIVGEPLLTSADITGRTTSRYFPRDGKLVALRGEGYAALRRLVEKVRNARPFKEGLSEEFVEVEIFKWWRARLRHETDKSLSAQLLETCAAAVKRHKILVPLANIEIERAFVLGEVLVTPIGTALFDASETQSLARFPERADDIRASSQQLRRDFAHLTGVCADVIGEHDYAQARAMAVATDIADVLRFMSPAAISWDIVFACMPVGMEHEPARTTFDVTGGELRLISSGMISRAPFRWRVSAAELDGHMNDGFRNCAVFFESRPLAGFEKRVKTAISAYSQGIATSDIRSRLIYAMSAAEHLLLRDENEPIQAAVGDRMAFMIAKTVEDRLAVVANFKKAYALRSKQVHHLAGVSDEETLSVFFTNMFLMLTNAMDNMPRFKEHQDFLKAIDGFRSPRR